MRFRRLVGAAAVVAIVALCVTIAIEVDRQFNSSSRYYAQADHAADLSRALSRVTIADQALLSTPSAAAFATADEQRAAAQAALDQLRHGSPDRAQVVPLATDVQRWIDSARDQVAALRSAPQPPGSTVAPASVGASADLTDRLDQLVDALRTDARQTADWVRTDVAVLAVGRVLIIMAILGWYEWRRRRWQRVEIAATERARFEAIVENSQDVILVTNAAGDVTYASPSIRRVLGYSPDVPTGALQSTFWDQHAESLTGLSAAAKASGTAGPADVRIRHADGTWQTMEMTVRDLTEVPEVGGLVWSTRDVTERRRMEADLERAAFQDALTHLANRALFLDRLGQAVARGRRHGGSVAVLLADLDGFKEVNDGFGHEAGDAVLVEVAKRLSGCVREGDTVARLGGDEFTILLENAGPEYIDAIAQRIVDVASDTVTVYGSDFRLGMSVGIATTHDGALGAAELLRNADTAMYAAKNGGRGRFQRFEPAMRERVREHVRIASELDRALRESQLEVYYQPIHSLVTGAVEGAEALVRWNHPERGLVPPSVFIPVAEQTGQIMTLGRWVLAQAFAQASIWHRTSPELFAKINVNLSGCQLADPNIVDDIRALLRETTLDPTSVVLEITESALMEDVDRSCAQMTALKDLGVKLAVDDFGTGYSSLAQLRRFPIDVLKIDRTFVAAIDNPAEGDVFVRTIVDLGATLRLAIIAEGVEARNQADALLGMGCEAGQGYLFSAAITANQFGDLLCAPV